jgi:hypothetical protein
MSTKKHLHSIQDDGLRAGRTGKVGVVVTQKTIFNSYVNAWASKMRINDSLASMHAADPRRATLELQAQQANAIACNAQTIAERKGWMPQMRLYLERQLKANHRICSADPVRLGRSTKKGIENLRQMRQADPVMWDLRAKQFEERLVAREAAATQQATTNSAAPSAQIAGGVVLGQGGLHSAPAANLDISPLVNSMPKTTLLCPPGARWNAKTLANLAFGGAAQFVGQGIVALVLSGHNFFASPRPEHLAHHKGHHFPPVKKKK